VEEGWLLDIDDDVEEEREVEGGMGGGCVVEVGRGCGTFVIGVVSNDSNRNVVQDSGLEINKRS
jgi:hypothetical protein